MSKNLRLHSTLLVVIGLLLPAAVASAEAKSPLACYEKAQDDTLLNRDASLRLCQGAVDIGPVTCFQAAKDRTMLSDDLRILLCQCAHDATPAICFEKAKKDIDLSDTRVIVLCNARATHSMGPNCR